MTRKVYTLKTVSRFSAAHVIPGHPGKCARLHGHNFKMEVEVKGHQLNDLGILIDFQDLKVATQTLIEQVDHQYLNEIPPFDKIIPSAENLAMWAYQHLKKIINNDYIKIAAVTIWESDNGAATYTEQED